MDGTAEVVETAAATASTDAGAASATPATLETQATGTDQATQQTEQPTFDASLFEGTDPELEGTQQAQPLAELLSVSPFIQDEQALRNAVERQGVVEAVLQGQQPASALFEGLRTQNPQQWQQLMSGVAEYIQQATGYQLVDPQSIQSQPLTPEQQRIAALEQQQQNYLRQQEEARQQQITAQAQKQLLDKLPELTKGRFIEGESPDWVLQQLGYRLQGKESQVIAQIARGDYSAVQKALADISKAERDLFNARGKRIAAQRNALRNALPKTAALRGGADLKPADSKIDTSQKDWFGNFAKQQLTQ